MTTTWDETDVLRPPVDLSDEPFVVRQTLSALGRLLGASLAAPPRNLATFVSRNLGVARDDTTAVTQVLPGLVAPLVGVLVGRLIEGAPNAVVADDTGTSVPSYELVPVGVDEQAASPDDLSAYLPAGEAFDFPVVLVMTWFHGLPKIALHVARSDAPRAQRALAELIEQARTQENFYRGQTIRASVVNGSLILTPVRATEAGRSELIHSAAVWKEIDANISGLTRNAAVLAAAGLGASRGLLIVGPPGVGKTALCRVIAAELPVGTTIIVVDSAVGARGLAQIYEALDMLSPAAVFLDDVDLLAGDRRGGTGGEMLGEFLTQLDGFTPSAPVITVGTTNVLDAIDPALLRPGRFDAVVHVELPSRAGRVAILRRYLHTLGSFDLDRLASATEGASGADLREIVRRTVLERGAELTEADLLEVIATARWRVSVSTGQYL